ncbi:vWA domain-containing protein [Nocardioides sambongensis]|uniref:vWA domain-containing protein n=1 Tax=Nocardioides sambongensis TaxID=2589074 RepID=UPI00112CB9B6|nr:hypothetical protein [Nocardioides sambongensis]
MNEWTEGDVSYLWPWLMVALTVLVVALLVVWLRVWWRPAPKDATYVAHTARLRSLPRFRALVRRQTALGAALTLAALVTCAGAILLSGRLQETQTKEQSEANRDIMLCLDASYSMAEVNADVVAQFQEIVTQLQGERIGLTIWNGTAITVFPLTDDYDFVSEQLRVAETAFGSALAYGDSYIDYVEGTYIKEDVASQLGDGLVSCVQRFDRADEDRARAVVLASDNDPIGEGIFTVPEATEYAEENDAVVHAIAAPATAERPGDEAEFEKAATDTGGTFSLVGIDGGTSGIVESINDLEAKKIEKPPLVQTLERPQTGIVVTALGVGLLVIVWAVQGVLALVDRQGEDRRGGRR